MKPISSTSRKGITVGMIAGIFVTSFSVANTWADKQSVHSPFVNFDAHDVDGDGKITLDEFAQGRTVSAVEELFKEQDANGDGVVTKEEVRELLQMHEQRIRAEREAAKKEKPVVVSDKDEDNL